MSDYILPTVTSAVSDTFRDHVLRGSVNPGTDYKTPYGSVVVAPASGWVSVVSSGNDGSGGRMLGLNCDIGSGFDFLHLKGFLVPVGAHVDQGQPIVLSGASGFGSDFGYDPHCHVSFRQNHAHFYNAGNEDFEAVLQHALTASTGSGGRIENQSSTTTEEDEMAKRIVRCTDIANVGGASSQTQAFITFGTPAYDGDALVRVFHNEGLRNKIMYGRGIAVSGDSANVFSPTFTADELADVLLQEVGFEMRKVGVGSTATQFGGLMVDGFAWTPDDK